VLKPSRSSSVRGGDFDLSSPTPLRPRPRARPPHQSSRLRPPLGGVVAIGVAIGLCKGVVGRCQRRCQWRCRRGLHNRPTHQPRARRGSMYAACLAAIVDGAPPSAHHVHQRGGLGTIWRTSARWKPQRQPQATGLPQSPPALPSPCGRRDETTFDHAVTMTVALEPLTARPTTQTAINAHTPV
jgi:hypothetical protein